MLGAMADFEGISYIECEFNQHPALIETHVDFDEGEAKHGEHILVLQVPVKHQEVKKSEPSKYNC